MLLEWLKQDQWLDRKAPHQLSVNGLHLLNPVLQRFLLQDEVPQLHEGLAHAQDQPGSILGCHLLEAALLKAANL